MDDGQLQSIEHWLEFCPQPGRLTALFNLPVADPAALFKLLRPLVEAPDRGALRVVYPPWWTPTSGWWQAPRIELIPLGTGDQTPVVDAMQGTAAGECILVIDADHLSQTVGALTDGTVQCGPAGQTTITPWSQLQSHRLSALLAAWRAGPKHAGAACVLASRRAPPMTEKFTACVEDSRCSVVGSAEVVDVNAEIERWSAALLAGAEPHDVVADIRAAVPPAFDASEAIGMVFYTVGDWDRAWSHLNAAHAPDPVHLANIAHHLGRYDEARRLMASVEPRELVDVKALGFARMIALRLGMSSHAHALADRLIDLHPGSEPGLEIRALRLTHAGRWDEVLDLVERAPTSSPGLTYTRNLARLATRPDHPASAFVGEAKRLGDDFAEAAWSDATGALLARDHTVDIARQLIACRQRVPRLRAAVDLIERIATDSTWLSEPSVFDVLCQLMDIALTEAARAPLRGDLRMALSGLFLPGRLGLEARSILLALFCESVRPPRLKATREPHGDAATYEEVHAYVTRRIIENPKRAMRLDHQDPLPLAARPPASAPMLRGLVRQIVDCADAGFRVLEDMHLGFMVMVHAALELIETEGGVLDGIDKPSILGAAGQTAAVNGYNQWAVQLAEGALVVGRTNARLRRRGWWVHADLHARVGHLTQALVAYLCCERTKVSKLGSTWRLMELDLRVRLARDLGLTHVIEEAYLKSRRVRARYGPEGEYDSLADSYWTSRLQELTTLDGEPGRAAAKAVLGYYARRLPVAYNEGRNIKVSLLNLGWTMEQADRLDVPIPADLRADFDRILGEMPADDRSMVDALLTTAPTLDDLRIVTAPVARTRYGADLPAHLKRARMVAGRLLGKPAPGFIEALVAIELLADNAIARRHAEDEALGEIAKLQARWLASPSAAGEVPTFLHDATEPSATRTHAIYELVCTPETAATALLGYLPSGSTLVAMATDSAGAAVLAATPPRAVHRSPLGRLGARVARGLAALDVAAGVEPAEATAQLIEALDPLSLDAPIADEVIVLPSATLASLPFNGLPRGGELLGDQSPVTVIPSLCWLAAVAELPARRGRVAWVLPGQAASGEQSSALAWIADRIGPSTEGHDFDVEVGFHPPEAIGSTGVAIVVAHGGLDVGDRLTRVVDERGNTSSADRFTSRVQGADVVIALICHGGRQTPTAERPTGLPRMLLSGETRAVVACPWALDARAAMAWLPLFLDEWASGRPLSKAVFRANRRLGETFPHPGDRLAMHVFGCPALCMPSACPSIPTS